MCIRDSYLDERILGTPSIAVAQVLKEVERMAQIARQNFALSMQTFFKPSSTVNQQIKQNEQVLNYLNHNITGYLVKIHALDLLESDSRRVGSLFHVVNDLERVGDHAENILEYSQNLGGGEPPFSADAITEMQDMQDRVLKIVDESIAFFLSNHPAVSYTHLLSVGGRLCFCRNGQPVRRHAAARRVIYLSLIHI